MENWKAIPGFEGYYEVSDHGRVYSSHVGRVLKPTNVRGYPLVHLHKKGPRSDGYVHKLVLLAFVGPSNGLHALHRNGDKTCNRLENLYYGTPRQNMIDRKAHGNHVTFYVDGEDHARARITNEDARAVKAWPRYKRGLYDAFPHIKAPTIDAIRCGRQWKNIVGA